MPTREQYHSAFVTEREQDYPAVTGFEMESGYAVDPTAICAAARILACPLKKNPPNWQHGRILYAAARKYLSEANGAQQQWIDVGTAKGFSACVMSWALQASDTPGIIRSFDIIDPEARVERNSIADTHRLQTVPELTYGFLAQNIKVEWHGVPFCEWWHKQPYIGRIHLAFIDGRHKYEAVIADAGLIISAQRKGDVMIFDDLQIEGVARAVKTISGYTKREIWAKRDRGYAIAVKD